MQEDREVSVRGEESQVDERPRVRVYKPTTGCINCANTFREFDAAGVPYQVINVSPEHKTTIDELKLEAAKLGAKAEYPVVNVFYPGVDATRTWFGHQPEEIAHLVGEFE